VVDGRREVDPDIFFGDVASPEALRAAELCAACPIRDRCYRWALDTGQQYGVHLRQVQMAG
jgi:WhiB family transcriptional regulator, redox-sensing transcriptional regulator